MKTHIFLGLLCSLSAVTLVLLTPLHVDHCRDYSAPTAGASEENPRDRYLAELMMLRDPATGKIPDDIRHRELAYARTLASAESYRGMAKGSSVADPIVWQNVGPAGVGGRTRCLGLDVSGEDTMIAGSVTGGVWRSVNGGANWQKVTTNTQLPFVTCLAQDKRPGHTAEWYFGTGEYYDGGSEVGAFNLGDGLFKSSDNGRSWTQLPSTRSGTPTSFDRLTDVVWSVVTDPTRTDSSIVYMATYGTVHRSANGGASWSTPIGAPTNPYSTFSDVTVAEDGSVYAALSSEGTRKGIWRSPTGTKWTNITPPNFPATYRRIVLGTAPSNPNVLYVLTNSPGYGHAGLNFLRDTDFVSLWKYTYVSGDGSGTGGTWENRSANLPSFGRSFGDMICQGGYDLFVRIAPGNENVVFAGGTNLYRSSDGFSTPGTSTWIGGYADSLINVTSYPIDRGFTYPNHHPDQHNLVFSQKDPNTAYSVNDGGIYKTTNFNAPAVSWTSLNTTYLTTQFHTVAVDHNPQSPQTVIGGLQDQHSYMTRTPDAGTPWQQIGGDYDGAYCAITDKGRVACFSIQQGRAYRVELDTAGRPVRYTRVDPAGGTAYKFINPFVIDPNNDHRMFLLGGQYIWRNNDISAIPFNPDSMPAATVGWERLDQMMTTDSVSAIDVSTQPAGRIYFGTNTGHLYRVDSAYSAQPSRTEITPASFPKGAYLICVAINPLNADQVMIAFSNYNVQSLFYTTDGGATWSPQGGNLEQRADGTGNGPSVRWVKIVPRGTGNYYLVGTSVGVFSVVNALAGTATQWVQQGASAIGNTVVKMLDSRMSDGFTAVSTYGAGVFTGILPPVPDADVSDGDKATGAGLVLQQNTPNPVRGDRTTFRFTLPAGGAYGGMAADLALFSQQGQRVLTVLHGPLAPGTHTADANTEGLPNGVYYCRLSYAGLQQAVRVVVQR